MRPRDLVLAALILAVIVGAGAYLALRSDEKSDSSTAAKQGDASSAPLAATAPTLPPGAPPADAPPAATQAPAAQPPAAATGAPFCSGPSLASINRTGKRSFPSAPQRIIDPAKTYTALIKTNRGDITATLAAKDAPITVNNFVFLACNGFYDGLTWHRVVKTPQPFVIQGGDPRDSTGGPGYQFANEVSPNLKHESGTLAMANAGPNTNGSQFYITLAPQPALDGKYNVFGKVTDGMAAVNAVVMGDKIESISIREN